MENTDIKYRGLVVERCADYWLVVAMTRCHRNEDAAQRAAEALNKRKYGKGSTMSIRVVVAV